MIAFSRALKELKGEDALTPLYERVPDDVEHAIAHGEVLTMGWYPMEWFAALHTAAQQVYGPALRLAHTAETIGRIILVRGDARHSSKRVDLVALDR